MRNHVLVHMTSAVILACGGAASAQAPGAQSPGTSVSHDPADSSCSDDCSSKTRRSESACESNCKSVPNVGEEDDSDQDGHHYRGGMMGGGMMGRGMMGRGLRVPWRGSRKNASQHVGSSHDDANDIQSDGR